ncbi:serine/threonine-protein phosphatase 6 regulatory ankyrin repeat subunit B-like [Strongylocentrotus purpuratus]|uniref:Protein kinase domain-containing protein n=1 Tax=Strongylocentrotus purpuratus TaxID=7668 RepID=A0A7M7T0H9_STRPU|nr:serine/threonine-protein phosphatase 6 regulatory ankyrin repeat subunit B-like [Strongylocentrotus purpuratus]
MAERAANEPAGTYRALHLAAANGDVNEVQYLIGQGTHIDTYDEDGNTPLLYASTNRYLGVVQYLVDQGADVDKGNIGGSTPLHFASGWGFLDVVQCLVGNKAKINKLDDDGNTALYSASKQGHLHVVEYLVGQGAQVEKVDNKGSTSLIIASAKGHIDVVKYLISKGANINKPDVDGKTPIYGASLKGRLHVVQYLVGQGALIENCDNHGDTPIHAASGNGHLAIVRYLVRQGAEIERTDNAGHTPLLLATGHGHIEVVEYLEKELEQREDERAEEVILKNIVMADLTVTDSSGEQCAFHEKKARDHEGCHLGGGSFGEVFKAVHAVHGDVAVKLAKPGKERQLEMYKKQVVMYQKEAQKHENSLKCEHIVPIKGFVQCEDKACDCELFGIVIQYMKNGSLWNFRTTKWRQHPDHLDFRTTKLLHHPDLWPLTNRMVYQISRGMHFLHSKYIIHRDLKLENVLVDRNLNVKVTFLTCHLCSISQNHHKYSRYPIDQVYCN